jgi:uncharacterized protein YecE (DUF72 family)
MPLYLGCPMWGWKPWVGPFFPPKTKPAGFLSAYSRLLNTVEGNTTFYALPEIATVERWRGEVPDGFKFCLKVPQTISHQRKLLGAEADTDAFCDRLERLGDRAGPSFLQLPPSFGARQLPDLTRYLDRWPRAFDLAVEPRHSDFFGGPGEADFDALLRAHNAARCIFDTTALFELPQTHSTAVREAQERKPRFALRDTRTADFAFVRFVGQPELSSNARHLDAWAARTATALRTGEDVFMFFHSPDDTDAPALIRDFHARLTTLIDLPPLPIWGQDAEPTQGTLF